MATGTIWQGGPRQDLCGFKPSQTAPECPNKALWHTLALHADGLDPDTIYALDPSSDEAVCLASCADHIGYVERRWSHRVTHPFDVPCAMAGAARWDDDGCYLPQDESLRVRAREEASDV